jgi:hypothetical protein
MDTLGSRVQEATQAKMASMARLELPVQRAHLAHLARPVGRDPKVRLESQAEQARLAHLAPKDRQGHLEVLVFEGLRVLLVRKVRLVQRALKASLALLVQNLSVVKERRSPESTLHQFSGTLHQFSGTLHQFSRWLLRCLFLPQLNQAMHPQQYLPMPLQRSSQKG